MYIPWESQQPCLKVLRRVRRNGGKKALIVMACGIGKTATAGFDVRDFLRSLRSGRVLYLCNQNGILKKARETFQDIIGGDLSRYGFYHGFKKERYAQFLFASFQTMAEHYRSFRRDEFDYIIADEAHHSKAETYLPVLKYFQPRFLLGITATPDREDEQNIREIFGESVFTLDLPEALAKGYLTPVDYRLIADPVVELGKIENPYALSMKELNRTIFVPRRDEEIVRIIRQKCKEEGITNPRILVFCNSIDHAERFSKKFKGSLTVHSGFQNDEQEEREQLFRDGHATALITVDKYNEGVDIPEVNVVVFLRSTESNNIFKQQLGRGLRKVKGKEKVLALDFVGNCERIRMIDTLKREIDSFASGGNRGGSPTPTVFDYGKFVFTEQVRDVLTLLEKATAGYSTEVLITQLQAEAKRLGRKPTFRDVRSASKAHRIASPQAMIKVFGSVNNALEAAGFLVKHRSDGLTKASIISQLKAEAQRLGKAPTQREVKIASKARRTPSANAIAKAFGSFNEALEAAGLLKNKNQPYRKVSKPRYSPAARPVKYSKDILIAKLQTEAKRLGKTPTVLNVRARCKTGHMPSEITFTRNFGTFNNALKAAGLEINKQKKQ